MSPVGCDDEEAAREISILLSPALPTSARMSPTRLSLSRVASLQSPLPFHLVSLFRLAERLIFSKLYESTKASGTGRRLEE